MAVSFDPLGSHTLSRSVCTSQNNTLIKISYLFVIIYITRTWGSVVGIATMLRTGRPGVRIPVGVRNVSVTSRPSPLYSAYCRSFPEGTVAGV